MHSSPPICKGFLVILNKGEVFTYPLRTGFETVFYDRDGCWRFSSKWNAKIGQFNLKVPYVGDLFPSTGAKIRLLSQVLQNRFDQPKLSLRHWSLTYGLGYRSILVPRLGWERFAFRPRDVNGFFSTERRGLILVPRSFRTLGSVPSVKR
ncbi:hypothetical protein AVEN_247998-1 [Araneus ventricosus]|uniref:Uncharacterized protein n=1 Tax=Araneus ventricosus TaxID=182803 RepID=A0A4Y2LWL8_ARAVE|nr:hypothetical protein AVEN_247998-1 [Araneus ventricosus]